MYKYTNAVLLHIDDRCLNFHFFTFSMHIRTNRYFLSSHDQFVKPKVQLNAAYIAVLIKRGIDEIGGSAGGGKQHISTAERMRSFM